MLFPLWAKSNLKKHFFHFGQSKIQKMSSPFWIKPNLKKQRFPVLGKAKFKKSNVFPFWAELNFKKSAFSRFGQSQIFKKQRFSVLGRAKFLKSNVFPFWANSISIAKSFLSKKKLLICDFAIIIKYVRSYRQMLFYLLEKNPNEKKTHCKTLFCIIFALAFLMFKKSRKKNPR